MSDVSNLIHTPADMMSNYVRWAESIHKHPGVQFGVPGLDDALIPMRPGNFVSVCARTSQLKTTMLGVLAKAEARRIMERGKEGEEIVVFVTWEQSAEEITNLLLADGDYSASDVAWGRVDLAEIREKAVKGVHVPIWIVGHGIAKAGDSSTPRMYPETILSAIERIEEEYGRKVTLMLFDYLQLIPVKKGESRVTRVEEAAIRIKEVALRVGAPAVAAVQARQEVDDRDSQFPTLRDGGWSKAIADTSDKFLSIWYPCRTNEIGDQITLTVEGEKRSYYVDEDLVFVRLLKQRFAPGFGTYAYAIDPARLTLTTLLVRDLNGKDYF